MYQYDKDLDFHALGREIKRKREAKGWTQEYLAQLVDRTPRSIMYMENRGQHPSLNVFYKLVTLLEISVYREMILLRYHHGYSVREIAGMMGISLPAAIKLDQRAKQKLKKLCEEAGIL